MANALRDKSNLLLVAGSILVAGALFLPWWSLHSSIVNGQQSLFDFTIGPLGMRIGTPIGDPSTLLAGFQVVYWIVTIALLPVSVSLVLGAFHGVYCVLRRRRGARVLIAPLWAVIGLFWWALYFLVVQSFFGTLGLNIPATGSADLSWQSYQLVGATWGWDLGLWLGVAGTAALFAGAAFALRSAKTTSPVPGGAKLAFGFHGIGLLLLALFNLGAMALLLASLQQNAIAWLLLVPVLLLFAMAFFARRPKATTASRKPLVPPLPKIPKPSLTLPKVPGLTIPERGPPIVQAGVTPAAEGLACPQCGQRFPTQVQLDAHKLTHTLSAQAADARQKMDELGRKLLRRP